MAQDTGREFAQHLTTVEKNFEEFNPVPYHERSTDSLIFYFRDEPSYSERINKYLTIFLSRKNDSLVGVEVKGVSTIMRAVEGLGDVTVAGPVPVTDEDGEEIDFDVIVRCALVQPAEYPIGRHYQELDEITKGQRVKKRQLCDA
jgi:hypothetical protein